MIVDNLLHQPNNNGEPEPYCKVGHEYGSEQGTELGTWHYFVWPVPRFSMIGYSIM